MNYTGRFALVTIQGDACACDASALQAREGAVLATKFRSHVGRRAEAATAATRRRLDQPMRHREGQRAAGAAAGAVAAGAARLLALDSRPPQARQHADAAQRRCRSDELQDEDAAVCADG